MVEAGLRPLTDDNGAMQTINIANQHGNVHLYVLHPIYVGEAIECIDCVPADQENNIGPVADNSLGQQNNGPVAENGAVVDDSIQVDDNGPDSNIGPVDHSGNCGSINVNKDKGATEKKKRKRGRPIGRSSLPAPTFEADVSTSDDDLFGALNIAKGGYARDLSDSEYDFEDVATDIESDEEMEPKMKYPTFVQPTKMADYKWEPGTYFLDK
ncbi:hypothetical protein AAZX31_02G231100 [Glycine max]